MLDQGVCLHGGSKHFDLGRISEGLRLFLPNVQGEVYLDTLYVDEEVLKVGVLGLVDGDRGLWGVLSPGGLAW